MYKSLGAPKNSGHDPTAIGQDPSRNLDWGWACAQMP